MLLAGRPESGYTLRRSDERTRPLGRSQFAVNHEMKLAILTSRAYIVTSWALSRGIRMQEV